MYGYNKVAKKRDVQDGFLVHSIFYTIQGEGPYAGLPAIFVRFTGCNLRCFWCDTEFEDVAQPYTADKLLNILLTLRTEHNCSLVVLTGGEPMLQPIVALLELAYQNLRPGSLHFQIETAGTVYQDRLENVMLYDSGLVSIVTSPKTPLIHPFYSEHTLAWKYIIRAGEVSSTDGLPVFPTQRKTTDKENKLTTSHVYHPNIYLLQTLAKRIYVQPCDDQDITKNQANIAEAVKSSMKYGYRLSLQLHKIANIP